MPPTIGVSICTQGTGMQHKPVPKCAEIGFGVISDGVDVIAGATISTELKASK